MLEIEVSALNGRFKNSVTDHQMAKNFFLCPESFFPGSTTPREVREFVSTTGVLSMVLPVRSLLCVF